MVSSNERESLERASELLARSKYAVALVGAGMSKESGIPTFRGEGGLWTTQGEPPMNQYEGFRLDPKRWWEERLKQQAEGGTLGSTVDQAEPNSGHVALAQLEQIGVVGHVITQNIDDLHRRAGQESLSEIHGNTRWMRCVDCESRWPREEFPVDPNNLPPRCSQPECHGIVKGDGVMFGEPIPPTVLERCERETLKADLFLSIGTSALVYPAAHYPMIAMQRGLQLIEINPEPTPLSDLANVVLRGRSGELLPQIVAAIRNIIDD